MKLVTPIKRHILDDNDICSCGRTGMQHLAIELANEKILWKWHSHDIELEKDFAFLGKVIDARATSTPSEHLPEIII